jgi:flagellar motor switch protein FliN/FliY
MAADLAQIQKWLIEEWISRLTAAFGGMTGEPPTASLNALPAAPEPAEGTLRWRQPLPPLPGAVWVVVPASAVTASGAHLLRAVGVEEANSAEQKSTFLEILNQAFAGLAQALTTRLKSEVNSTAGQESSAQPGLAFWTTVSLSFADNPEGGHSPGDQSLPGTPEDPTGDPGPDSDVDSQVTFTVGIETALAEAIFASETQAAATQAAATPVAAPADPAGPSAQRSSIDNSKTFQLLLDVELPVAVSFGHALIALKDALRLTPGSIVELDRAVTEPVEILVNNCVIARGEVVVVDGNFGVRVQQVVDRQERLRTVL